MVVMPKNVKMVIFDLDGTIAKPFGCELLPNVADWFAEWRGMADRPEVAIATNQGGVAFRFHALDVFPDTAWKYPVQADVENRLTDLTAVLGIDPSLVYVSFAYQLGPGQWVETPIESVSDPRWNRNWRKPNPGMVEKAMADNRLQPNQVIMVGDQDTDKAAAIAAGVPFAWASHFFQLPIAEYA